MNKRWYLQATHPEKKKTSRGVDDGKLTYRRRNTSAAVDTISKPLRREDAVYFFLSFFYDLAWCDDRWGAAVGARALTISLTPPGRNKQTKCHLSAPTFASVVPTGINRQVDASRIKTRYVEPFHAFPLSSRNLSRWFPPAADNTPYIRFWW